jgi:hypothetical protein
VRATISTTTRTVPVAPQEWRELAQAQLDGLASAVDLEVLEGHEDDWVDALRSLRREVQATIQRITREVTGPERQLVLDDFEEERGRIDRMLTELTGKAPDGTGEGATRARAAGGGPTKP